MNHPSDRNRPFSPFAGISAASLATTASPPTAQAGPPSRHSAGRTQTNETTLRTRIHPDDKRRFESLCVRLSESLHVTVRPSNLLRALLVFAFRCEASLHAEARSIHGLVRPPNDNHRAMAEFESSIAGLIERCRIDRSR